MLYNENLREEEQHLIQQIAEQTERGKIELGTNRVQSAVLSE